ncbi:MAG: hypothetical protein KC619_28535 [Myxococcales bacterium]|nr:hypothetical protein [Myxococcales bacterium]
MTDTFELDAVPPDCPWQIASRDPATVIDAVFAPLASDLPTFVRALEEACTRVTACRTTSGEWRLCYHLERRRPEAMCVRFPGGSNASVVYMGGPPAPNAELGDAARAAGWSAVPPQLLALAAVHDGFGPEGPTFGVESILPVQAMAPLGDAHPDWLEVRCDSVGHRRLLLERGAATSLTADWDRETGELAEEMSLFAWLDEHVACELLDLDRWDFPRGPYPPGEAVAFERGARFDELPTVPYDPEESMRYYAVDVAAWRTDEGRRAVDAILGASSSDASAYLEEILTMTTLGRLRAALEHVVDPAYVPAEPTDDCAHSWALEAMCLVTGCTVALDGFDDVLDVIEETLRCSPLVDGLPFGLPTSRTGTPYIAHTDAAGLLRHCDELRRHIDEGAFGEHAATAERYRDALQAVGRAGLGLVLVGW